MKLTANKLYDRKFRTWEREKMVPTLQPKWDQIVNANRSHFNTFNQIKLNPLILCNFHVVTIKSSASILTAKNLTRLPIRLASMDCPTNCPPVSGTFPVLFCEWKYFFLRFFSVGARDKRSLDELIRVSAAYKRQEIVWERQKMERISCNGDEI